ncbi:MAG TPA: choice-of-anchor tandem repeat GloVer-containing protein [Terriglobales bacterium]|nr:choice-of-anchor tandem repeat GloVer-containing protein [Terriglobales bacterium]
MRYADVLRRSLVPVLLVLIAAAGLQAQTFSVLYNFGSNSGDPYKPAYSGIIAQGRDGNLYSTAPAGGTCCGAVFQITTAGKVKNIHNFTGSNNDGAFPQGGVTLGSDGNFYGTTYEGGSVTAGAVFKVTPGGTYTTLYSFTGGKDGAYPYAPPVQGNDGNFYGTTTAGGNSTACGGGCGTIYKITPAGALTTLYEFDITHGYAPYGPLVLGTDGNFYGTTPYGTTANAGVVFKITPAGKFTLLFSFDSTHGETPFAGLVQGADGNFYGTTIYGGTGGGVVFKITSSGKLTVLHEMNGTTDGARPFGGLVLASDGNFYGANAYGGTINSDCSDGCGTFFKITPKGAYSVLGKFDYTNGATPEIAPFQHTGGVIYGDSQIGGTGNVSPCATGNCGVFYSWKSATLPAFVSLLPYSGKVGKTVEFLGQGFKGTSAVSFGGTAAKFQIVTDTYLTATVPAGATTGSATVKTSSGTFASNRVFRVTPQILSFNPTSGTVGTSVTITGVSLKQTTKVAFGGVVATTFTVNSDKQVTATVPTGAQTGHITITTPGGVAVSKGIFTVTMLR